MVNWLKWLFTGHRKAAVLKQRVEWLCACRSVDEEREKLIVMKVNILQDRAEVLDNAIANLRTTVLELSKAITLIHAKEQSIAQLRTELESLRTQMQDVRELREMMRDPKRFPIVARTGAHFRSIMEQEHV